MHLDSFGQKHWYYRLKREYTEEAKVLKRLEERKAKKDFRKMLKKLNIQQTLDDETSFESFYGTKEQEEFKLPAGFTNEQEYHWYNKDADFMRFHKRTKANMKEELQRLISSSSQTVSKGVLGMNNVTINYIELNKASSLIIAYWSINNMGFSHMPDRILRDETITRKDELAALIEEDRNKIIKQAEAEKLDPNELQSRIDMLPSPLEKVKQLNRQKQ